MELQNKEQFENLVLKASGLVLVDFWAPWCGPCRMISPILDDISDIVSIVKINVDDFPEIANEYEVQSVPTLILFRDGEDVASRAGFVSKPALLSWIETRAK